MTDTIEDRLARIEKLLEKWRDIPVLPVKTNLPANSCSVCGMSFVDAMGRPLGLGYVCQNIRCPTGLAGPTF